MFKTFFNALGLPCCLVDAQASVLAWNNAMQALTGIDAETAYHQPFGGVPKLTEILQPIFTTLIPGQEATSEVHLYDHAYRIFWTPLPSDEWALLFYEADREQNRSDMLNAVSHDLRTPLAAIKGYLELIANLGALNERQKHFWGRAQLAIQEMSEFIDRLLDIAWIDAGMKLDFNPLNLIELTYHSADRYSEWAKRQQVNLQIEVENIPPVYGDERRLRQVINNLISNAIKYSPDGGTVTIQVKPTSPQEVEFSVLDQGLGIPAEHLPHIFDRFFRVPGTRKIEGTGLGLFICRDIVKKHGYDLQVESQAGVGSRFYFTLPLAEIHD